MPRTSLRQGNTVGVESGIITDMLYGVLFGLVMNPSRFSFRTIVILPTSIAVWTYGKTPTWNIDFLCGKERKQEKKHTEDGNLYHLIQKWECILIYSISNRARQHYSCRLLFFCPLTAPTTVDYAARFQQGFQIPAVRIIPGQRWRWRCFGISGRGSGGTRSFSNGNGGTSTSIRSRESQDAKELDVPAHKGGLW